jgi:UDP-N-acetylglucosamine acyltransferase
MKIHHSSVISSEAELADDVEVGPFCYIRGKVKIDSGTILESHVSIGSEYGVVEIGKHNRIFAGSAIGGTPQDKKYKGEATKVVIGDNNQIRECVTVSLGTVNGGGLTKIGNDNLIMAYAHFGHDDLMGDFNVIANNCQLAGHVTIHNRVTLGGSCAVNQFVRIGDFAFIGGASAINKDILPYSIAQGNYAVARATNKIGLERNGKSAALIEEIHRAIRALTKGTDSVQEAIDLIQKDSSGAAEIKYLLDFLKDSKRGIAI